MDFRRGRPLLVLREVDDAEAKFVTQLSLRNACVAFHDEPYSMHRSHLVVEAAADLPSPLQMHGYQPRLYECQYVYRSELPGVPDVQCRCLTCAEHAFQAWDELVELWQTIVGHLEAKQVVAVADAVS